MKMLDLLLEETQLEPQPLLSDLLIESLQELHGDLFESNNEIKFLTRLSSGGIELTNLSNSESRYEKVFLKKRNIKELYPHLLKKNNNSSDEDMKLTKLRLISLTKSIREYNIKNSLLSASIINPNKEQYFFGDKSDNDKFIFKLLSIDLPKSPNERSKTKYYEAVISIDNLKQPSIITFKKISNRGGFRINSGVKSKK